MAESQTGTRRRRKAERPTEILQAALEEFSLSGFAATRLEDVAVRAGVTKGTIYLYFAGKEELFVAMLKDKSRALVDNLRTLSDDPQASAVDILRRHLEFVGGTMIEDRCGRDILRILLSEGQRFPKVVERWFVEVMEPATDSLKAVLQRGIEQGEFRTSAVSHYPQLMMAPCLFCISWLALAGDRRPADVGAFVEAAIELLVQGLVRT